MIDYKNLTSSRPTINYDTTTLTIEGYELKFAFDLENPDLQEVVEGCKRNSWPYKIIDDNSGQKHIWIKGWER